ncbi:MAG: hypothetical protein KF841_04890 [Phycisphaerae bacterium]|nr:hypothetical protein [Phycisphaerae bacterium]
MRLEPRAATLREFMSSLLIFIVAVGLVMVDVCGVARGELIAGKCGKTVYWGCDATFICVESIGYECVKGGVSGCKEGHNFPFKLCISYPTTCFRQNMMCYRDYYVTDFFCGTCEDYCNEYQVYVQGCW